MTDQFRFSPRPNRAHLIQWQSWGSRAFADAVAANKPVLLNLTAVWCHWCHLMDETTYSDPALIELINDNFVAIRVDADKHPHVQDRYIAGGWPTNAFLTPTGEVLWSGTYVPPEQFDSVAKSVLGAWSERHVELQQEIERRRKALQAARGRHHLAGLVRREAADDVLSATIDGYDPRNGGFGIDPKFPYNDAVELLFAHGRKSPDLLRMADHTLDGMLAGQLLDQDGGFFRYAVKDDWTEPRREKLLWANASLLRVYALGAQVRGRPEWQATAEKVVRWANEALRRSDGLWAGSQPLDGEAKDDVLYTSANAQWIGALAEAGARLGRNDWIEQATTAFDTLIKTTRVPGGLFRHYDDGGADEAHAVLLVDVVEVCRAAVQLAQVTGRNEFLDLARELIRIAEKQLWAEDGGFWDCMKSKEEVAALRYREKPFDTNADFARVLNDVSLLTGEKSYRALAERILALLSPQAGRFGPAAASFALAVDEFFDAPARVVIVGTGAAADALRQAALRAAVVQRRVLTMAGGGKIAQFSFPAGEAPAAFVVNAKGASPALQNAEQLENALARG